MKTSNPMIDQPVNYIKTGQGFPVALVHGLAASLHDWDFLIPELVQNGYTAYAPDLLGHGESYKPQQLELYNAEAAYRYFERDLQVQFSNQPLVLIGHSLGAYFTIKYALLHPEQVKSVVLVNPFYTITQLPKTIQWFFQSKLLNTALIERTPYQLFRFLVDLSSFRWGNGMHASHILSESVRDQTALDYKRAHPGIFNIPRTITDLTPSLTRLGIPVLGIWGEGDSTLHPDSFGTLVHLLPHIEQHTIPLCGHVPHQCHSEKFNQLVLNFLKTYAFLKTC